MQTILMFSHLEVVLVLDGARWPLKSATHTIRRNKRGAALEKAVAADNMNDSVTADKYYKQAVHIPDEFVSWIIQHGNATARVSVVIANYEADAQLHQLRLAGKIDRVLSAAEDSDFLVYGMDNVMYGLRPDGAFHHISVHEQVIGQHIGEFDFTEWHFFNFRVWSCGCGCDYVDNIHLIGCKKTFTSSDPGRRHMPLMCGVSWIVGTSLIPWQLRWFRGMHVGGACVPTFHGCATSLCKRMPQLNFPRSPVRCGRAM